MNTLESEALDYYELIGLCRAMSRNTARAWLARTCKKYRAEAAEIQGTAPARAAALTTRAASLERRAAALGAVCSRAGRWDDKEIERRALIIFYPPAPVVIPTPDNVDK